MTLRTVNFSLFIIGIIGVGILTNGNLGVMLFTWIASIHLTYNGKSLGIIK